MFIILKGKKPTETFLGLFLMLESCVSVSGTFYRLQWGQNQTPNVSSAVPLQVPYCLAAVRGYK